MLLTQALKKLLKDRDTMDKAMLALQRLNLRGPGLPANRQLDRVIIRRCTTRFR